MFLVRFLPTRHVRISFCCLVVALLHEHAAADVVMAEIHPVDASDTESSPDEAQKNGLMELSSQESSAGPFKAGDGDYNLDPAGTSDYGFPTSQGPPREREDTYTQATASQTNPAGAGTGAKKDSSGASSSKTRYSTSHGHVRTFAQGRPVASEHSPTGSHQIASSAGKASDGEANVAEVKHAATGGNGGGVGPGDLKDLDTDADAPSPPKTVTLDKRFKKQFKRSRSVGKSLGDLAAGRLMTVLSDAEKSFKKRWRRKWRSGRALLVPKPSLRPQPGASVDGDPRLNFNSEADDMPKTTVDKAGIMMNALRPMESLNMKTHWRRLVSAASRSGAKIHLGDNENDATENADVHGGDGGGWS